MRKSWNLFNKIGLRRQIKMEMTLSIIKPDAVSKNVIGKILQRFEDAGLKLSLIHI